MTEQEKIFDEFIRDMILADQNAYEEAKWMAECNFVDDEKLLSLFEITFLLIDELRPKLIEMKGAPIL